MSSERIVFVTTELAPTAPGGAGTVVAELATRLVGSGRSVTVLLLADPSEVVAPAGVDVTLVTPPTPRDPARRFVERSRSVAEVLPEVVAQGAARVEFQDFDGLGFWALSHRADLGLAGVPLTVRFHGPIDLMWDSAGAGHEEWATARVMERESFAMADEVIVPSEAFVDVVVERYGLDPERVRVGPPPVPEVAPIERSDHGPVFVAIGRLGEVKGSHDLVAAAIPLLRQHLDAQVVFLGADGWSAAEGRFMQPWLRERLPVDVVDRVVFAGHVDRAVMTQTLARARAVVVPSRFESFCLAAHEARRAGVPVIVPDLPAFVTFDESTGALTYDGTVAGLTAAMDHLAASPAAADRLARAPAPAVADPLLVYGRSVADPRHERVQAGLATAAVKRLEATLPTSTEGTATRVAKAVLRALPDPVARFAVGVLPQVVKDRFRDLASWPEEAERRRAEAHRAGLLQRIADGDFPVIDDPDVTIVIPCYDQGAFVEDAILSVFAQSHRSWEIVVVDDGSTDPDTVATLGALDLPRVRVHHQENRGLPGARNAGIALGAGRFAVPLDADDELAPEFLERLLAALETEPGAAYAHCWSELFGEQSAIWVSRPWNAYQLLLSNSVVGCVLLRREAWAAVGGYAQDMTSGNEDWDLWLRLLDAGWGQVEVREPLFRYRKHGVSMSVETEARFEQARAAMPDRHPALYARDAFLRRKTAAYPWVSVLLDADGWSAADVEAQDLEDIEVVEVSGGDVQQAVRRASGKFVIDGAALPDAEPHVLRRLAEAAESAPSSVGASAGEGAEPVLWRRWTLLDPEAPRGAPAAAEVTLHAAPRRSRLDAAMTSLPGWSVGDGLGGDLPVLRQRPEEDGPVPTWVRDHWTVRR